MSMCAKHSRESLRAIDQVTEADIDLKTSHGTRTYAKLLCRAPTMAFVGERGHVRGGPTT